ncbi:hypothetical protein [Brevibacillus daliensis]|uniref:hypothetical protein n=1 Tax=Brevibacillus daliensis TaxID=2892995 RepID=UPI001E54861B|nr:hypothetical protein [Brevibacillus daliensis]
MFKGKWLVMAIFIMFAFLVSACSGKEAALTSGILGHWVQESDDPKYPDIHYYISQDKIIVLQEGEATEHKYKVQEKDLDFNRIKILLDDKSTREITIDDPNQKKTLQVVKEFEDIILINVRVDQIWTYVDEVQTIGDPKATAISLVDDMYNKKDALNVPRDEFKNKMTSEIFAFTWKAEKITARTEIFKGKEKDNLLTFEAVIHDEKVKMASLHLKETNDVESHMKNSIALLGFLKMTMPDVEIEEATKWSSDALKKLREEEDQALHLSHKGKHYDYYYDKNNKEIVLKVVDDKTKTAKDEPKDSTQKIYAIPPYEGVGMSLSDFKFYFVDEEPININGKEVKIALDFTEERDQSGKAINVGRNKRNDIVLTLVGRSENVKIAELKIHANVPYEERVEYMLQFASISTEHGLNKTMKAAMTDKEVIDWLNKAIPLLFEKGEVSHIVVGEDVLATELRDSYYVISLRKNLPMK